MWHALALCARRWLIVVCALRAGGSASGKTRSSIPLVDSHSVNYGLADLLACANAERPSAAAAAGVERASEEALDWRALRAKYVNASMRDGTGGDRATGVRHWLRFCLGRRVSPIRDVDASAPLAQKLIEEAMLMDFALWLVLCRPLGRSIAINTASGYVGTVRAWHQRRFGYKIGADLDLSRLRDMLKGMRREIGQPPRKRRYGVRTQQLAEAMEAAFGEAPSASAQERLNALNWKAALSTAFCALMRGAEFALQPGEEWDPELHLARSDLSFFFDKEGRRCVALMMRPCKNGQHLRGKTVRLVLVGGATLIDPVEALWQLVNGDPVPEAERERTPLFRRRAGAGVRPAPLTVAQVRDMVKALMLDMGEDPKLYGAHSLRIGGATAALAAGVSPAVIRLCGRWNSDIWEIYARISREATANVTSLIGSTPFHDLERGFHADELEMLPDELAEIVPEFEDAECEDALR